MTRRVSAFVSASFSDEAEETIRWFCDLFQTVGIEPLFLKWKPEARKSEDKIRECIEKSDVFIQILTKVTDEPIERRSNWIQNELGIAREKEKTIAIFAEKGVDASGLGAYVTDIVSFDRGAMHKAVPRIVQCLSYLVSPRPEDYEPVCRNCGAPWPNPKKKTCRCWYTARIMVHPGEEFVCMKCGANWPEEGRTCGCGGFGDWTVRLRKEEHPKTYGRETAW